MRWQKSEGSARIILRFHREISMSDLCRANNPTAQTYTDLEGRAFNLFVEVLNMFDFDFDFDRNSKDDKKHDRDCDCCCCRFKEPDMKKNSIAFRVEITPERKEKKEDKKCDCCCCNRRDDNKKDDNKKDDCKKDDRKKDCCCRCCCCRCCC